MMRHATSLVLAGALAAASSAAGAATWHMATVYPTDNYQVVNGRNFAECVKDATDGALDIVVHPNGSLFSEKSTKRAVQRGQANMAEISLSAYASENPLYAVDAVPFLATSFDQSKRLWAVALPEFKKLLDEQNMVYAYSVPWPSNGIFTKDPVNHPDDLKGAKMRTYNKATAQIADMLGMTPVQIDSADLNQALSTNVVSVVMTSSTTGVDQRVWESGIRYFYDASAWLPRSTIVINKKSWDGLDADTQESIAQCGAVADREGFEKAKEQDRKDRATLEASGVKIVKPSAEFAARLNEIGDTMTDAWRKAAGAAGQGIVDTYRKESSEG